MAIAITNLTSNKSASNPSTTASISPAANSQVFVAIGVAVQGGDSVNAGDSVSVSGCNLTWTQIARNDEAVPGRRWLYVFRGTGASPSSGSLTITFTAGGGQTWIENMWIVDEATGVDGTTPIGTATTDDTNASGGTSSTVTVSGTPDAGDFVYAAFLHTGAASDMSINSELSNELAEIGSGTDVRRLLTAYDSSPDASPTPGVTWSGTEDYTGIAFIVKVGGASQSNAPRAAAYYRMMRNR